MTIAKLGFAFACLTFGASSAQAGWNNVFQSTGCRDCNQTRSSYFAPPPTSCQKIEYVQRSYYTPVTVWKRECYQEPVTVKYRSFYWEPVTETTYTSYYDPCTGCSKSVAVPRTSYRLRSQENCSQRYVQRSRLVPVTEQRVSYYMEPVIVSNYTPEPACNSCAPAPRAPSISETPGAALGNPDGGAPAKMPEDRIAPQSINPSGYRAPQNPPSNVPVRMDRISSRIGNVQGTLVGEDRFTPRGNARVTLVNKSNPNDRKVVSTDAMGRFTTQLPGGDWSIYVPTTQGQSEYHSTLAVRDNDNRNVTIVSW